MSTMLQQVMTEPGKIIFQTVEIPRPKEKEVLIKIMMIGVCGSDIHVYHGNHPYTPYPVTQGHEVSGIIEGVGSEVKKFRKGDVVTIQPQVVCGECYSCKNGKDHICKNLKVHGFQTTGMASHYFVTEEYKVVKLPKTMDFRSAAMIEPLSVACHAVSRVPTVEDFNVLILGAGPIGNLVSQTVKSMGCKKTMITDISDYRLRIAKEVGVDFIVNPLKTSLTDEILKNFGEDKADLIIECVGCEETMNDAISNARKGTDIIIVGVFGKKVSVDIGLVQDRELRLIGTLMYQRKDYEKAVEIIRDEKVNLKPLFSNTFRFEEYLEAYKFIEEKKDKVMKVFIEINEE